ncbi:sulfotransferase family 2 domain-containing protein [Kordiimonas sp. SCSIO 12603]|uniref:sulfotransferase family 2 domain-containing protein n=1 Tax=Kordiimonas sp. SCSIO 12603 TaxID=2829596 RepID=UPI0021085C2E|nr:sulfotransferase family 2 domain-containing protein [Kordiimonas sp. SCSIO 12603]UTW59706.1 sulfotransferase family 2 domain-containing protein [Kordiimonas sp. SCSIO 12603]
MSGMLFIHIPKTAGTSFLKSVRNIAGYDAVEVDYGPDVEHSTKLVRQFIYEKPTIDEYSFYEAFQKEEKELLGGHFFSDRYLQLFGAENTISFVREPVDRVISEYFYLKKKHGLDQPFEEFYRSPAETNKQFRMIGQVPWRAFDMVGSLQSYGKCLERLSGKYAVNFSEERENIAHKTSKNTVPDDVRSDILAHNDRDQVFVSEVEIYLQKLLQSYYENKVFCYHDFGFIPDQHIIGWAFYQANDNPVELELWIDGQLKETILATEHRPELQLLKTPRGGHNGFRVVLSPYSGADKIQLIAKQTGQYLLDWKRT